MQIHIVDGLEGTTTTFSPHSSTTTIQDIIRYVSQSKRLAYDKIKLVGNQLSSIKSYGRQRVGDVLKSGDTVVNLDGEICHKSDSKTYLKELDVVTPFNNVLDLHLISENKQSVIFKSLTGQKYQINELDFNTVTIGELKQMYQDISGVPPDQARFVINGRACEDSTLLSKAGFLEDNTVNVVLRLRGGMMHETSGFDGGLNPMSSSISLNLMTLDTTGNVQKTVHIVNKQLPLTDLTYLSDKDTTIDLLQKEVLKLQQQLHEEQLKRRTVHMDPYIDQMLDRQEMYRHSQQYMRRFSEAERTVDSDWMDVTRDMQAEVIREFLPAPACGGGGAGCTLDSEIQRLQIAALQRPDKYTQVRFNRANPGALRVGQTAPPATVYNLDGTSFDVRTTEPTVFIAGSYS
jgi:hypothetical protein